MLINLNVAFINSLLSSNRDAGVGDGIGSADSGKS
jgi:hypothetical protein